MIIIRIHIIGGAGSGKSHIANLLQKELNIRHYDLDDIFWDNSSEHYGVKTPEDVRRRKLERVLQFDQWILEGVYIKWVEPSLSTADKIFVLKPSLELQERRIWDRYYKRLAGELPSKKKETKEGINELIDWNRNYNDTKLSQFIQEFSYKEKLIVLENNMDIYKYL
ncbi:hypothetical protein [Paenibacillus urinalis]|uniref:hypothetical protein n=1 Tax=Paenibacillus urinalis TaxID=521520 RepID=UPI001961E394